MVKVSWKCIWKNKNQAHIKTYLWNPQGIYINAIVDQNVYHKSRSLAKKLQRAPHFLLYASKKKDKWAFAEHNIAILYLIRVNMIHYLFKVKSG